MNSAELSQSKIYWEAFTEVMTEKGDNTIVENLKSMIQKVGVEVTIATFPFEKQGIPKVVADMVRKGMRYYATTLTPAQ